MFTFFYLYKFYRRGNMNALPAAKRAVCTIFNSPLH